MDSSSAESAASPASLVDLCIQAAASHEFWRVQRRQLACLPEDAANELLRRLLEQRRLTPPLLELFAHSATVVHLQGSAVAGPWLASLGAFSALHQLRLSRCQKLRDAHLAPLAALGPTLQHLDLSGCSGLTDGSAPVLQQLANLRSLDLSGTQLSDDGVVPLCGALTGLTSLILADLQVGDACCQAMGSHVLQLQRLSLSGTAVTSDGMRSLEQLSALAELDLSFTRVGAPPAIATLTRLSMAGCRLAAERDSLDEAMWLHSGASLPHLQLASATLGTNGEELLACLLGGAAGSLRELSLREADVGASLAALAGASQLTRLDLTGTATDDFQLAFLVLAPLEWLSLAGTSVGDEGVAQLLAMTSLRDLDLSRTRVTDASWAVLSQLPRLSWLDLTATRVSLPEGQPEIASLTWLSLRDTDLSDKGCMALAAAAPRLKELAVGSRRVGDRGFKALCSLPKLESLALHTCEVSRAGLWEGLPRCTTLRRLSLFNCWLANPAVLQAAAVQAAKAGCSLQELSFNGAQLEVPALPPGAKPRSPGSDALRGLTAVAAQASGAEVLRPAANEQRPRAAAVLPPEVLAHDERLVYTREEMLSLVPAKEASPGRQGEAAEVERLRQRLPQDLLLSQ